MPLYRYRTHHHYHFNQLRTLIMRYTEILRLAAVAEAATALARAAYLNDLTMDELSAITTSLANRASNDGAKRALWDSELVEAIGKDMKNTEG
jgi:hypothetical protein